MAEERRSVHVVFKAQLDGFGMDMTAECLVDHLPGLVAKLRAVGVEPAHTPYVLCAIGGNPASTSAPCCPIHHTIMKESKHKAGEWFCSASIGLKADGNKAYCDQKVGG